jgi:ligand-binding sensor domain-containing protein/anti-sigma regulatory factor (Ser/Thr protein kinase)
MRSFDLMRPLFPFLLWLLPMAVLAQHPSFWTLDNGQGLPSLKVYDLMEDSLGMMWMGTSEGLAHYDGLRLEVLHTIGARADDRSILHPSTDGRIWSINFRGEMFLSDHDAMKAIPEPHEGLRGKVKALERKGDSLLILTERELAICHAAGSQPRIIAKADGDDFFLSNVSDTLVLTMKGLLDVRSGTLRTESRHVPSAIGRVGRQVVRWYKERGTVTRLHNAGEDTLVSGLRRKKDPVPFITLVRATSAGTWILTYDGAFLVEEGKWLFPNIPVSDVVEARDGSHWFATLTDGVKVVPDLTLARYAKDPDGLPTERFNRIRHLPDGNIVASDNNGMLVLLHQQKGLLASFRAEIDRESEVLEVDTVHGRILVAFGDLYLLDMGTLRLLDTRKGNFKSIAITDGTVHVVNSPHRQRMTYDGRSFGKLETVSEAGTQAFSVMADAKGNIWWLTDEGVLTNGRPRIPPSLGGGQGEVFRGEVFRNITQTPDGRIVLSGPSDSIAIILQNGEMEWVEVPRHITEGRRIRTHAVSGDRLFVLMSDAIGAFDFKKNEWTRIAGGSGLPATDLRDLRIRDGEIWIASFNGLYAMSIHAEQRSCPPKVMLRSVRVNGQERMVTSLSSLRFDENDIELVLRGISTGSRGKIRFAYRLNGSDDEFEVSTMDGTLRFRALAPGSYRVEAIAIAANGERSPEPLVLDFTIAKPWYATWPFFAAMALLLVAVISVAFLLRIRLINRRNSEQMERTSLMGDLRQSRLTALRAQMNPHFMFNVLNSVQGLFNIGRTEKANEVLARFSDLMRTVLDMSGSELIPLSQELELIDLYLELEAVRFGDSFTYAVTVADGIDPEQISVPSMLIQPYAENAVKHGLLHRKGEKRLDISVEKEKDVLKITIDDNGVGRQAAAELRKSHHRSFATAATSSRVELLNAERKQPIRVEVTDKTDAEGIAVGTSVIILIPNEAESEI